MARRSAAAPARVMVATLAVLAALPSLQWCAYAWSEVPVECLLGVPAACAPEPATTACGPDACGADAAPADDTARGDDDSGGRAWCPGGPLGGSGLEARLASVHAPAMAPLPTPPAIAPPSPPAALVEARPRARPPTAGASSPPPIRAPPHA
jgi:hypothetical protein